MRKILGLLVLGVLFGSPASAAENRRIGWEPTATFGWEAGAGNMVRFTTTTTAANAVVCVVSTHTAYSLMVPSDVTFSPVQTSSTTNTWGGRQYVNFQVVDVAGTGNFVSVDLTRLDISTNTSPRLTDLDWFSPDQPIAWQGELCLQSPSTFTVTGWYWNGRSR